MTTTEQQVPTFIAGTYDVDPVHSRNGFGAKNLGISTVRGRFTVSKDRYRLRTISLVQGCPA